MLKLIKLLKDISVTLLSVMLIYLLLEGHPFILVGIRALNELAMSTLNLK